jgi:hypothetical protein
MKAHTKNRKTRHKSTRVAKRMGLSQQVARQKKSLMTLAGIGASGFTDISEEHDKYLHEKP